MKKNFLAGIVWVVLLVSFNITQASNLGTNGSWMIAGVSFQETIESSSKTDRVNPLNDKEKNNRETGEADLVPILKKTEGKKTQVSHNNKERLIEGYKISRNGKGSTYVYGEIIETKKGLISGYLYDKKGHKTYIYGEINNNNVGSIYARDKQKNIYIFEAE